MSNRSLSTLLLKTFILLSRSIPAFFLNDPQSSVASGGAPSALRFEPLKPLTEKVHQAGGDVVHCAGDLNRSFLFQIRQYRASPPDVFER